MSKDVVVIIGIGGMGEAIARRQGPGKKLVLADFNEELLARRVTELKADGFDVTSRQVDVSLRASVQALADAAAAIGRVDQLINTAGLSPAQAPVAAILNVDLLGVALVLDTFATVIAEGGAGVIISSMAGYMSSHLTTEEEFALATTEPESLLALPIVAALSDPGSAYGLAKRANQLRVRHASLAWGKRGGRINSVSPGVISTSMGKLELEGPSGTFMRAMIEGSGTGRIGTPSDISNVVSSLLGPDASFITGTDLLVDGGVVASISTSPSTLFAQSTAS